MKITFINTIDTDLFFSNYDGSYISLIQKVKEIITFNFPQVEFVEINFVSLLIGEVNTTIEFSINSNITQQELDDRGLVDPIEYTISD
jgi:hypothetical protein